ncbi:TrkH family potassium uptake protein [Paenibacillus sp. YK5]|uniref:TrkH family potassium uptake protein n=2 Tax=Paenibacillus TaxID=44249 RepID=A0A0U2M6B9_9BACL|nr:TrkH family potassium uptake protein [Paenibacillus naphthalenovorans]GCL72929.1 ATP synthase subunit J [Paenibacillus naphthalenovorans]SDJ27856.1 trk system potassium uptake protein TrkH [Paenibacillus naphthalenovorans]
MKPGLIMRLSPPQILVYGFTLIIMIGAVLLSLPIATVSGESMPFLDALFTATSATCVTGLVLVDTGTYFSAFGQLVLILLIQIGGLGFMTMAALIALVFKRKISLKERLVLQTAMNQGSMEGIVRLIRKVLLYSLTIEFAAAVIFSVRWSFEMEPGQAIYYGIFHAISFFNNAGFDLFGAIHKPFGSMSHLAYDWIVNLVAIILIVLGGIGFIVIADLLEYHKTRKLSLHSKVVLSTTGALTVIGFVILLIFEFTNHKTFGALNGSGKLLASLLHSVTPRSAGVTTVDVSQMRQASQFFLIILMFIGASPGSAGGGIKTTTFAILVGALVAMVRGKEDIVMFRYRLGKDRILKAITLTMFAIFMVVFITMLLSTTEDHAFLVILFEVTSAFGTVGLSMGLTPQLTEFGKVVIALTMFTGRLGPMTLAYALGKKTDKELYRYPEGKITIG